MPVSTLSNSNDIQAQPGRGMRSIELCHISTDNRFSETPLVRPVT